MESIKRIVGYTDFQTNADRETLARLDELVISPLSSPNENNLFQNNSSYSTFPITPPPEHNSKDDDVMGMNDVDMEEVDTNEMNDEISTLPKFSRFTYINSDQNDDPLVDSLASPLSALGINDDDDDIDILHDFNNRDRKVQELITLNKRDFETIKQSFDSSGEEWQRFLRVLYAKSEIVPDREWFDTMCEFINPIYPLRSKFKELICNNNGNYNIQTETINDSIYDFYGITQDQIYDDYAQDQTSEINDDYGHSPSPTTTGNGRKPSRDDDLVRFYDVDLKEIRHHPERLANFEDLYSRFFNDAKIYLSQECRARLGYHFPERNLNLYNPESINDENSLDSIPDYEGHLVGKEYDEDFVEELRANAEEHEQSCEDSKLYGHFVQILLTPRRMMPDDLWEESIYECLNNWPHLIAQLKEIVAYELYTIDDLNNGDSQEITVQL